MTYCANCGTASQSGSYCSKCGTQVGAVAASSSWGSNEPSFQQQSAQPFSQQGAVPYGGQPFPVESKKTLAGVLGIFLGAFGIHKFVLGYTTEGILAIVITIFTCGFGGIIGLIEGIIYLTKSDEEFVNTYQLNKRGWF